MLNNYLQMIKYYLQMINVKEKMKKSVFLNVQMGEDINHTSIDISNEPKGIYFIHIIIFRYSFPISIMIININHK